MRIYRIIAILLVIGGLILVLTAAGPIVSYELVTSRRFVSSNSGLLSPLSLGQSNGRVVDLTRASNWFVGALPEQNINTSVSYYTISIPKLRIQDATTQIAGEDLSKNLIHYKGTAPPGRIGNAVVFGHSILPQFFNPKNYMSIFSTLPTLTIGDEIFVDYDGIRYKFIISEMTEVQPTDIGVLAQPNDKPHLTLITCVPPGTYLRRLVVKAELVGNI
ncbi:sortase [Candidatus Microgenomates bacterium]|nr:sortase [Candidatus Microgenomates bacterium]